MPRVLLARRPSRRLHPAEHLFRRPEPLPLRRRVVVAPPAWLRLALRRGSGALRPVQRG